MNRFNNYFSNFFSSCRCLAHAFDQHRERDVKIYQMPGYVDAVGVTDGVDCWVAPVTASLFSLNIEKLLGDLGKGIKIPLPVMAPKRLDDATGPRRRASLSDAATTAPPEPTSRTRRHLIDPPTRIRHRLSLE